jgi:sugar O-acyltransferase (sialic acid O-acetyltransferase NeuD family)
MTQTLAIVGFGGHGRVVLSALRAAGLRVVAATDLCPTSAGSRIDGLEVMTDQQLLSRFSPAELNLVSGIGSVWPSDDETPRCRSVQKFTDLGYRFVGVRHPFSWVAPEAHLTETCQIHAGAVIQPGAMVGEFTIINTRASVGHDCVLADYCHIGPGATLSGNVEVGAGSHVGTGCTIIQGIRIGQRCLIAAGATVVRDVPDGESVRGTPARIFRPRHGPLAGC